MKLNNDFLAIGAVALIKRENSVEQINKALNSLVLLGFPTVISNFFALSLFQMVSVTICFIVIYNVVIDGLCKLKRTPPGSVDDQKGKKKNPSDQE